MPGRIVVLARPQPFPIRNQGPATQIVAGEVSDTGRTAHAADDLGAPIDANESIIEPGPQHIVIGVENKAVAESRNEGFWRPLDVVGIHDRTEKHAMCGADPQLVVYPTDREHFRDVPIGDRSPLVGAVVVPVDAIACGNPVGCWGGRVHHGIKHARVGPTHGDAGGYRADMESARAIGRSHNVSTRFHDTRKPGGLGACRAQASWWFFVKALFVDEGNPARRVIGVGLRHSLRRYSSLKMAVYRSPAPLI